MSSYRHLSCRILIPLGGGSADSFVGVIRGLCPCYLFLFPILFQFLLLSQLLRITVDHATVCTPVGNLLNINSTVYCEASYLANHQKEK